MNYNADVIQVFEKRPISIQNVIFVDSELEIAGATEKLTEMDRGG